MIHVVKSSSIYKLIHILISDTICLLLIIFQNFTSKISFTEILSTHIVALVKTFAMKKFTFVPCGIVWIWCKLPIENIIKFNLCSSHSWSRIFWGHIDNTQGDKNKDKYNHHNRNDICSPVSWLWVGSNKFLK